MSHVLRKRKVSKAQDSRRLVRGGRSALSFSTSYGNPGWADRGNLRQVGQGPNPPGAEANGDFAEAKYDERYDREIPGGPYEGGRNRLRVGNGRKTGRNG